ncbi:MAG: AAA family ATPase [Myxococcota bacterium]
MSRPLRTFVVWALLLAAVLVAVFVLDEGEPPRTEPAAVLRQDVAEGDVVAIAWGSDGTFAVTLRDGDTYAVRGQIDEETWTSLYDQGVAIDYPSPFAGLLGLWPILGGAVLVVVGLLWFLRRVNQGNNQNILQLRQSKAKKLVPGVEKLRFADVAGMADAKERMADVVDLLRRPERWKKAGARIPRGVLLEGPPGCGKTLLARAVAGEAGVPFFVASASEFVEMFVGVGAARVRDLFENARKAAPAVIFIDELDAVGRKRGTGIGWGHDEREQTLNQLLVCLDGFERDGRLVVIAATNRAEVLDAALLRPGRFDVRVSIPELDEAGRLEALRIHARDKALAPDVSLDAFAAKTAGLNGAAIEQVLNEAAIDAVRRTRGGGEATIGEADLAGALARLDSREKKLDALDTLLLESASQLAHPNGVANVRVTLTDGSVTEGALTWADGAFLKVGGRVLPKVNIRHVEPAP